MADKILRMRDVQDQTGLSRTHIRRLSGLDPTFDKPSDFPRPLKLTERTLGWKESEITAWIESRPTAAA